MAAAVLVGDVVKDAPPGRVQPAVVERFSLSGLEISEAAPEILQSLAAVSVRHHGRGRTATATATAGLMLLLEDIVSNSLKEPRGLLS